MSPDYHRHYWKSSWVTSTAVRHKSQGFWLQLGRQLTPQQNGECGVSYLCSLQTFSLTCLSD